MQFNTLALLALGYFSFEVAADADYYATCNGIKVCGPGCSNEFPNAILLSGDCEKIDTT
jgi:hypothetical protein